MNNNFCPNCGFKIEDGNDQFCMNCGYNLGYNNSNNQNYNMNNNVSNGQFQGTIQSTNNYSNGWGIAGFVCSLVSLLCCGIIVFAGLPMSIVGLVNANKHNGVGKGLSIAGIVISGAAIFTMILRMLLLFTI